MPAETHIRSEHPNAFRSGEWAKILTTVPAPIGERDCYLVEFKDGTTDWWPVEDPAAGYEFKTWNEAVDA